jgi:hypothetical protein
MSTDRPDGMQERRASIEGCNVHIVSYRVGDRFGCRVDNIDPGDVIGRGRGATRDEAEHQAVDAASLRLALSGARSNFQKSVDTLRGPKK